MHSPVEFSSNDFSYNGIKKTFAAEASDLGPRFNARSFYIRSAKTGNVRLFLFERAEYDGEGDLVALHFFVPEGELRAVVFND